MSAVPSTAPWVDPAPARPRRSKIEQPLDAEPTTRRIVGKREVERYARLFLAGLIRRYCTLRLHGDSVPYAVWASNETLAEEFGLTAKQLRLRLKSLQTLNLILVFRSTSAFRRWIDEDAGPNLGIAYPQGRRRNRGRVVVIRELLPAPIREPGYGPLGYRDPVTTVEASATAPTGSPVEPSAGEQPHRQTVETAPSDAPSEPSRPTSDPVAISVPREGLRDPSDPSFGVTEGECAIALQGECAIALEGARHKEFRLNEVESIERGRAGEIVLSDREEERRIDAMVERLEPAERDRLVEETRASFWGRTCRTGPLTFNAKRHLAGLIEQAHPDWVPPRPAAIPPAASAPGRPQELSQGNPRRSDVPRSQRPRTAATNARDRLQWRDQIRDLVQSLPTTPAVQSGARVEALTDQIREFLGDRIESGRKRLGEILYAVWTGQRSADSVIDALVAASSGRVDSPPAVFFARFGDTTRPIAERAGKAPATGPGNRRGANTPLLT